MDRIGIPLPRRGEGPHERPHALAHQNFGGTRTLLHTA